MDKNSRKHERQQNRVSSSASRVDCSGVSSRVPVEEVRFESGICMIVSDFVPRSRETVVFDFEDAPISFGFILSSRSRTTVAVGDDGNRTIDHPPVGTEISYMPKSRGMSRLTPGVPVRMVSITVPRRRFATLVRERLNRYPAGLRSLVDGSSRKHYRRFGHLSPAMHRVMGQILACPFQCVERRLYLEGKAMELLAYRMNALSCGGVCHPSPRVSNKTDAGRIHDARNILAKRMKAPPGLNQLARMVGINDCKLKKEFKRVYGMTVYEYVRNLRFETACRLLKEGRMSVGEIALAVGYSDLKHFYQTFKKRFGVPPGVYRSAG